MEGISVEALGAGGALLVLVVGIVLWKVLKLALKLVLCIVALAIGAVAGVWYLQQQREPARVEQPPTNRVPQVPPVPRAPLGPFQPPTTAP